MIKLGSLVQSSNNTLGIGKVIEVSGGSIVVEYFSTIGQRWQEPLPLQSLSEVILRPQTRCYVQLKEQDKYKWVIGRISGWDEDIQRYEIDLPGQKSIIKSEQEVYVRCNLTIKDPVETLAIKAHETPYLHQKRSALIRCLIQQRAVSRGMSGLISSNIHLYPHQVEVIRQVLQDSVQRYVLADEAGLGKTIEAGVILRQYLLDEPEKKVVVLVPGKLLQQWKSELENKFYIFSFPTRVVVLAYEDSSKINAQKNIGLLILDEAHHIAAMANSQDSKLRQNFEAYKYLAHRSEHLLLLSASHILQREQELLVLLHLLEPTTYQLNNLEDFQQKIDKDKLLAQLISSLINEENTSNVHNSLKQLQALLPEDKYLLTLLGKWEDGLKGDSPAHTQILKEICTYANENYRLYTRILSNRRACLEDNTFNRNITPKEEYDLDERSPDIDELLERWRTIAPKQQAYQRIFLLLFLASGTWLGILERVIAARQSGVRHPLLLKEFSSDDINLLTQTPQFEGEEEVLTSLRQVINQPSEDGDRIELLKIIILYRLSEIFGLQSFRSDLGKLSERIRQRISRPIPGDYLPKIVIFTSFGQTCLEIARSLANAFDTKTIAVHQSEQSWVEIEKNLQQFYSNPNCFILICDASAQEGHNFEFVDWVINFDLPWQPHQLEQRITRFDRIGRSKNIDFTVLVGADLDDSLHYAWYQLLKEGFSIFTESITNFQLNDELSHLEQSLFQLGAIGLLKQVESIKNIIAQAQFHVISGHKLNKSLRGENNATFFPELNSYDLNHLEIKRAIEGWIDNLLKFKSVYHPDLADVKYYQATKYTLVPLNELKSRFINSNLNQFGTYNRQLANHNPGIKLYRIGEGLVDALSSYIEWDDRGQAFALWRQDSSWDSSEGMEWFGFQCNYLVEFNLEKVQQIFTDYQLDNSRFNILKRQVDALFPPLIETIFIDARSQMLREVQDELLLSILQRPYQKDKTSHGLQDHNLAKERLGIIDNFIAPTNWSKVCQEVGNTSRTLLTQRQHLIQLCQRYAHLAEQKLAPRIEQLSLRLNTQTWDNTLAEELKIERLLKSAIVQGIHQPQLQLDSVGFIVISAHSPTPF
jgi:ATP-dependent helicase HepA